MPDHMAPWDGETANSYPGHRRPRRRRGRLRHDDRANGFVLRRYEVPVLPPGSAPLRVLHISDTHLTPGRKRLMAWVRALDELDPHLVVNTGDSIRTRRPSRAFSTTLGPLLDRPGVFVLGSNDMYAPEPHNPARYLMGPSSRWNIRKGPDLPWEKLRDDLTAAGWLDLNNERGRLTAGGLDVAVAGVHDAHVNRDRYEKVAGQAESGRRPAHRGHAFPRAETARPVRGGRL